MDKDLLKGLLMIAGVFAALLLLFVLMSASEPDKAQCIADALKAHIPLANIDKACHLSK